MARGEGGYLNGRVSGERGLVISIIASLPERMSGVATESELRQWHIYPSARRLMRKTEGGYSIDLKVLSDKIVEGQGGPKMQDVFPEMVTLEDQYMARLCDDLGKYEFERKGITVSDQSHKWRIISGMQKAIRRGRVEMALTMIDGLMQIDAGYTWRRLNTIVIEEVGCTNMELCGRFLWASSHRVWLRKNGGELEHLYCLVEQMCMSIKDRTACDLGVWAFLDEEYQGMRSLMTSASRDTLGEIIKSGNCPDIPDKCLAAMGLGGMYKSKHFTKKSGVEMLMDSLNAEALELDAVTLDVIKNGALKQYELMPYVLPFFYRETKDATRDLRFVFEDDPINLPDIGLYPSSAFDRHTSEGKRAAAYFLASTPEVRQVFENAVPSSKAERLNALTAVIFWLEGRQGDRLLDFPNAKAYRAAAIRAALIHNDLPEKWHETAMIVVRGHIENLHKARCRILNY